MEGSRVEWIGWKGGLGKREWEENEGGTIGEEGASACVRALCVKWASREGGVANCFDEKKKSTQ